MRRDHGPRDDRQKSRLMWLVEDWGVDKFRDTIAQYVRLSSSAPLKLLDSISIHTEHLDACIVRCSLCP